MTFLPLRMEILVNVIGYAGFIGIATWHKSSDEITTDFCRPDVNRSLAPFDRPLRS